MSDPEPESDNIDKYMKEFEKSQALETEQKSAVQHILTPKSIASSIANITKMIARWSEIPEIEFSKDDETDFANALEPFANQLDELLKYLPYLPLGIFVVGYSMKIISGFREKRKRNSTEKAKREKKQRKKPKRLPEIKPETGKETKE